MLTITEGLTYAALALWLGGWAFMALPVKRQIKGPFGGVTKRARGKRPENLQGD